MKNNPKQGISLIVLVITVIVMTVIAGVTIITLEDSDSITISKDAVTNINVRQIEDLANAAWVEAYNAGKVTQTELENAVYEVLAKQNIDISKYNITVTEDKVTVTHKD